LINHLFVKVSDENKRLFLNDLLALKSILFDIYFKKNSSFNDSLSSQNENDNLDGRKSRKSDSNDEDSYNFVENVKLQLEKSFEK
jgi:hypothetical protein